ncbi:hypothetical protein WMY93_021693 [Mugilogobius chulae]|uniref:Uncharacterized protein n=1 Tax=Mugilogobius chulae TaxID=88201 RepID=A0AAW0NIJ4_9GOBI
MSRLKIYVGCAMIRKDSQDFPDIEEDFIEGSDYDGEQTVEWDPDLSETFGDDSAVIVINYSEEATQVTVGSDLSRQSPVQAQVQEHSTSEENLLATQSIGFDFYPEDLPFNSGSLVFPSQSPRSSVNEEQKRELSVRRVVVVKDLVEAFMDNSIMHSTVKMTFVNEVAVDDAGVSRDVYTAFWEQFLEQCEGKQSEFLD